MAIGDGNEQGDDALRLEEQLCFAVYSATHAFNRVYRPLLAELGLTYPQYLVMLVLWGRDGQPVKAIGERLMLDSGTLTPLLKRLQGLGFVERVRGRDDERQVLVHLTESGRKLRAAAVRVPVAIACAVGGDADRRQALLADMLEMRDRLLRTAAERD